MADHQGSRRQQPGRPGAAGRRQFLQQAGMTTAGVAMGALNPEASAAAARADPFPPSGTAQANMEQVDVPRAGMAHGGAAHRYRDLAQPPMTNTGSDQIPRKPLGRTGVQVSIIGIGGAT